MNEDLLGLDSLKEEKQENMPILNINGTDLIVNESFVNQKPLENLTPFNISEPVLSETFTNDEPEVIINESVSNNEDITKSMPTLDIITGEPFVENLEEDGTAFSNLTGFFCGSTVNSQTSTTEPLPSIDSIDNTFIQNMNSTQVDLEPGYIESHDGFTNDVFVTEKLTDEEKRTMEERYERVKSEMGTNGNPIGMPNVVPTDSIDSLTPEDIIAMNPNAVPLEDNYY